MKLVLLSLLLIIITSCSNTKKTFWCGDHPCVNKAEKDSYYKENLIMEVRNINKKDKKELSNYEKIMKQAQINQKKKILSDKKLAKEIKKEKRKEIKRQKEIEKQAKKEKKRNLKKESKDKLDKKKNKNKPQIQVEKTKIYESKFEQLVSKIKKRNALKPYPNINNIPY